MFVLSFTKRQIRLCVIILILLLLCSTLFIVTHRNIQTSKSTSISYLASTQNERISFLSQFGIEVDEEPAAIQEIILPDPLDPVLQKYNALQIKQGFQLEEYAGKRVKRWSYPVLNYPNASKTEHILANILIYDGKVIGGDISSTNLNGFMHELALPKA